jgi:nicotinamide mononucleotide (NMN) deamidase PncC
MPVSVEQLIEQIHGTPTRLVLAVSGGGSRAIAELAETPGASRTLLEAIVPYCETAMLEWLGGRPDHFCSSRVARSMALAGFNRARKFDYTATALAGVACTAGLATDRPKLGPHRAHVAVQTASRTAAWSLELDKGRRSRLDEERLVSRMILNAVADACDIADRLDLPLLEGRHDGHGKHGEHVEHVEYSQTIAPQSWRDLLLGKTDVVFQSEGARSAAAIFSGAFNPMHAGHHRMIEIAEDILGVPVALELSILNVDKPPLDYAEIAGRLQQFPPQQPIWLTRAATFEEKSHLFPGATFIVGVDTLRRIAAPRYYTGDPQACLCAVDRIAARGCRFLVFGRIIGNSFVQFSDLDLPDVLRDICREVLPEQFREDISSTAIRNSVV